MADRRHPVRYYDENDRFKLEEYVADHPNKIINNENAHQMFNRVAHEQPRVSMLGFYESWGGPYKYAVEHPETSPQGSIEIHKIRAQTARQKVFFGRGGTL